MPNSPLGAIGTVLRASGGSSCRVQSKEWWQEMLQRLAGNEEGPELLCSAGAKISPVLLSSVLLGTVFN